MSRNDGPETRSYHVTCMRERIIVSSENGTLYNLTEEDLGKFGKKLGPRQSKYVLDHVRTYVGGLSSLDLEDDDSVPISEAAPSEHGSQYYVFNIPAIQSMTYDICGTMILPLRKVDFCPPKYPFLIITSDEEKGRNVYRLDRRSFRKENTWKPEHKLEEIAKSQVQDLMRRGISIARAELYDFLDYIACACPAFNCASFYVSPQDDDHAP